MVSQSEHRMPLLWYSGVDDFRSVIWPAFASLYRPFCVEVLGGWRKFGSVVSRVIFTENPEYTQADWGQKKAEPIKGKPWDARLKWHEDADEGADGIAP